MEGEVAFFGRAGGLLALYGEDALARDAGHEASRAQGFRGVSLAINLEEREDVDRAFAAVRTAGAHNPAWPIGPYGRPALSE